MLAVNSLRKYFILPRMYIHVELEKKRCNSRQQKCELNYLTWVIVCDMWSSVWFSTYWCLPSKMIFSEQNWNGIQKAFISKLFESFITSGRREKKVVCPVEFWFRKRWSGCSLIILFGRSSVWRKACEQWIVFILCLHNRKSINLNFIVIYGHGFETNKKKKIGHTKNHALPEFTTSHYECVLMVIDQKPFKNQFIPLYFFRLNVFIEN